MLLKTVIISLYAVMVVIIVSLLRQHDIRQPCVNASLM